MSPTYRRALLDAEGWVRGVHVSEVRPPRQDNAVPLSEAEQQIGEQIPGLHHGPDGLELAQDDRIAWRALRRFGRSGPAAALDLETVRRARGVLVRDLSVPVADPPPRLALGAPAADVYPDVPGLALEPMHAGHLDEAAQIAVDSGLEVATCPDGQCQPPEAHAWLQLAARLDHPDQWQFALTFQGRPLQYEVIVFDEARTTALFTITYHASRERPSWFWREAERPVFEAMGALGIRRLLSRTRSDRPDWIASLKANYGAVEVGTRRGGAVTLLEYPLEMSRFAGWPARKQASFDRTLGRVRVWEATAADLPALHQLIDETVPIARKALAHRVAEEWWHLDRAALLLGARDGVLRYARAIRHRSGTRGGMAFLSGLFDEPELELSAQLANAWAKQAGYTTLSIFAKPEALTAGRVPQLIQARQARVVKQHTQFKEAFTEIEFDVV